ncbi:MAG: tripartite tricarboxylate transporter permease [Thermodesulfobacteriota bacterium]
MTLEYYFQAVGHSLTVLTDPTILLLVFIGSIGGILAGAIPGISVPMAIVLTLPFTFGMTPIQGLATMCGVYIGGMSGGLVTAILLGIPGAPSAVATVFDGYPMQRKGEGGMALGIGIWASFWGGILGCLVLMVTAPFMAPYVLKFGPWEIFSLIVFGMTIIASLGEKSIVKGLLSGVLGMIAGCIGADPIYNTPRLTFGFGAVIGGVPFVPTMIGMYAVSQLMLDTEKSEAWKREVKKIVMPDRMPFWRAMVVSVRKWRETLLASAIGVFIGALPGAGSAIANIFAYDQVKKFSKKPELFGTGIAEGVVASESANSAVAGGSLIPTVTLGLPGNMIAAIMMGALLIHGIQPGPLFMRTQSELAYGLFTILLFANLSVLVLQFYFVKVAARLLNVPGALLIPIIFVFCVIGAYSVNSVLFEMYLVSITGIMAYGMVKGGIPLAPFILGLILAPIAETNFRVALMTDGNMWLFLTKPISGVFLLLSVVSVIWAYRQLQQERAAAAGKPKE